MAYPMMTPRPTTTRRAPTGYQEQYQPTQATYGRTRTMGYGSAARSQPRLLGTSTAQQAAAPKTWFQQMKNRWYGESDMPISQDPASQALLRKLDTADAAKYWEKARETEQSVKNMQQKFTIDFPIITLIKPPKSYEVTMEELLPTKKGDNPYTTMLEGLDRAKSALKDMRSTARALHAMSPLLGLTGYIGGAAMLSTGMPELIEPGIGMALGGGAGQAASVPLSIKGAESNLELSAALAKLDELYKEIEAREALVDERNTEAKIEERLKIEQLD